MPTVRQINTQQVDEQCPACNSGWMRPTGIVPAEGLFEHKCNSCGYTSTYNIRYPYTLQG